MGIGSALGGLAQAGASVGAATIEANSADKAAQMQLQAAQSAQAQQMKMYQQTRGDLAPFMTGGAGAYSNLAALMGQGGPNASASMLAGLQNYPGYQFALQQGNQALDRSAASKGLLLSGGQMKDLTNYNQGMATQLFGNYYNQLLGMGQLGENAAAGVGNAGMSAANASGTALINAASGAGQSQMLGAGAMASGINNAGSALTNAFNNWQMQQPVSASSGIPDYVNITPSALTGTYA